MINDLDSSLDFAARQTEIAFSRQWEELAEGHALLSDDWFRTNVDRILWEEEIQVKPEWFKGKWILDAGCGNGRWSYGFAKLGANITAVDANQSAISATRKTLEKFDVEEEFHISRLENVGQLLSRKYDLVFCWGVLHHCHSFNKSFDSLTKLVSDTGMIYMYLYGRDSLSYLDDLELFKKRIYLNSLPDEKSRLAFLLKMAGNDPSKLHTVHDIYAPLINRRLDYDYVRKFLESRGFGDVTRTIDHTELFVRAIRINAVRDYHEKWILPRRKPPYWFQRYR